MFPGAGCGQMSLGGWVLMGLFWVTFLGLVLWALTRLFSSRPGDGSLHEDSDNLAVRLARAQMDLSSADVGAGSQPRGVPEPEGTDDLQATQV
jgi:hypothetical protein